MRLFLKVTLLLILIQLSKGFDQDSKLSFLTVNNSLHRIVFYKVSKNTTGNIYLGATNSIYCVSDKNFELQHTINMGPVLDNIKCLPSPMPCKFEKTLSDNVNKILLINLISTSPFLVACGSVYQGRCSIISLDLKKAFYIGDASFANNFLASKKSNYALWVPKANKMLLLLAHDYDNRPLEFSQPTISIRKLTTKPQLTFKYFKNQLNRISILDINKKFKTIYNIDYIYGFYDSDYSYFLKRQVNLKTHQIETRLARLCTNDTTLTSYIEITLDCNYDSIPFDYGLTAFLGPLDDSLLHHFNIKNVQKNALFISFASSSPNHQINPNFGSHVCCFPLQLINERFEKEIDECSKKNVLSNLLTLFHGEEIQCQRAEKKICSSPHNPYIDGKRPYHSDKILAKYPYGYITSLATAVVNSKTIMILGTQNGTIMKWYMSEIVQSFQVSQKKIEPNPALDLDRGLAYLISDSKLIKYPFGSCAMYSDCGSCVSSFDPLDCGWCSNIGCIQTIDSSSCNNNFSKVTCKPHIIDFWPKSGPIEGGTNLTIYGKSLSQASEKNFEMNITVAGHVCEVIKVAEKSVSCITSKVNSSISGIIEMHVIDISFILGYDIKGSSQSKTNFSYLIPVLKSIEPNFAPFTQPSIISLMGQNLNIGSHLKIELNQIGCKVLFVNSSLIQCAPGKYDVKLYNKKKNILVKIDKTVLSLNSTLFSYVPDPVFSNITPKTITATSSNEIFIQGKHLTSIYKPKIKFIIRLGKQTITLTSFCKHYINSTNLICQPPKLPSNLLPLQSMLQSYITFFNGHDQEMSNFPNNTEFTLIHYPDPIFEIEKDILQIDSKKKILKVKGQWLSKLYNISFFLRNSKTNSSLFCCNLTQINLNTLSCLIEDDKRQIKDDVWQVIAVVGKNQQIIKLVRFFESNSYTIETLLVCFILILILLVFLTLLILWIFQKKGYIFKKTRPAPEMFSNNDSFQKPSSKNEYKNNDILLPLLSRDIHYKVDSQTKADLVADNILFSRDYLKITDELIGKGEFGVVTKGLLRIPGKNEEIEVAVKTLRRRCNVVSQEAGEAFLREGLRMKDLTHENVLSLIGICFDIDGVPLVITPYMHNGDLYSFLREENREFMLIELLNFGIQVAEGMSYLAQIKFVHRDLAARNCMVDKNLIIKVADFGLARDVYLENFYTDVNKPRKQLPIRWMAIESIEQGIYTIKTDVWSFGVLLWELVTRCSEPPFYGEDKILLSLLKFGRRLPQPDYCPDSIYRIMLDCWHNDPEKRPNFSDLVIMIKTAIQQSQEIYLKLKKERTINYSNFPISDYYNQASILSSTSSESSKTSSSKQ